MGDAESAALRTYSSGVERVVGSRDDGGMEEDAAKATHSSLR